MQNSMNKEHNENARFPRSSGILMPVFSLPSAYGIGSLGREAYEFIDFLEKAGQRYWQVLPLNPTGYCDSPYSSYSVFAGNPYFIDLEALIDEGLLAKSEVERVDFGSDARRIDYEKLYLSRLELLTLAMSRANLSEDEGYLHFLSQNADWLDDYALFSVIKARFSMKPWYEWVDEDAKFYHDAALQRYCELLADEIKLFKFTQYRFFLQWAKVKSYANSKGIGIIGDLPIYCALDSSDVWAHRELFQLDEDGRPTLVAGVPPDAFTQDGQLWGNPLYDWEKMRLDGYTWWGRRLEIAKSLFDVVRIDHFRALESYWAVPAGDSTARNGHWVKGPGQEFTDALKAAFPTMRFIAEDLGFLTEQVHALRKASGFPGMKVLEFAFDPSGESDYLPHNYEKNCACYTGTHDNAPLYQFVNEISKEERAFIAKYLGVNDASNEALAEAILRAGLASSADLFVAQIQDWLSLGEGSRINTPGTSEGNWQWRLLKGEANDALAQRIAELTRLYGR